MDARAEETILGRRLTRRTMLRLGLGAAGATALAAFASACGSSNSPTATSAPASARPSTAASGAASAAASGAASSAASAPAASGSAAGSASAAASAASGNAGSIVFTSTQLVPVDQAEKMRKTILKDFKGTVDFIGEAAGPFNDRIRAEAQAAKRTVNLIGGLHGDMVPFGKDNLLQDLTPLLAKLGDRGFPKSFLDLARLGTTDKTFYIPWMQATYFMGANKKALQYLPQGADQNKLTYAQLKTWGENIQKATGQRRIGFPGGPMGLIHRFFQGYLYPAYTNSSVVAFKSAEAAQMWSDFRDLWAFVNPQSTSYAGVSEPMQSGEIWVGWDHNAGWIQALTQQPDDFVTFPAPAGPKGRAFMPVLAGLAIPVGAPNQAGAEALIDYLTQPAQQIATAREVAFFPVTSAAIPDDLSAGVKLEAQAIKAQSSASDGLPALLPVGLGSKGGDFNKVYLDTFTRIVVNKESVQTVLEDQAKILQGVLNDAKAPCWSPDPASEGVCTVK